MLVSPWDFSDRVHIPLSMLFPTNGALPAAATSIKVIYAVSCSRTRGSIKFSGILIALV